MTLLPENPRKTARPFTPSFGGLFDPPRRLHDPLATPPDRLGRDRGSRMEGKEIPLPDLGRHLEAARAAWRSVARFSDLFGDPSGVFDLQGSVGLGGENRPADLFKLQSLLHREGLIDAAATDGPSGFLGSDHGAAIQAFQRGQGLAPDGRLEPGGETIRRFAALYGLDPGGAGADDFQAFAGGALGHSQSGAQGGEVSVRAYTQNRAGHEVDVVAHTRRAPGGAGESGTNNGGGIMHLAAETTGGKSAPPVKLKPKKPEEVTEQDRQDFIKKYRPIAEEVGKQYGVDPELILGLSAYESGWGWSRMALEHNNLIGSTPDGKTSSTYSSPEESFRAWGRMWGERVRDSGANEESFTKYLLLDNQQAQPTEPAFTDNRGAYNSEKQDEWRTNLPAVIRSVKRRYKKD